MKQTIGFSQFVDAFRSCDQFDDFGYNALKALFEHIEDMERDTGDEYELDVIALCCDFCTHDTALAAATEYGFKPGDDLDADDQEAEALEWLQGETTVIEFDGGVIVQSF